MKTLKKLLLNLFALLLLPPGVAIGQAKTVKPANDPASVTSTKPTLSSPLPPQKGPPFNLTELQKAHLDASRQEVFRWQDKMNEALQRFSLICTAAQIENDWPAVQCSLTDLAVTAQPPPPPPLKPADK